MSGKQQKKIRQLVRRKEREIYKNVSVQAADNMAKTSWDVFFESISKLRFRSRLNLAIKILKGQDLRKLEKNAIRNTGNSTNS